MGKRMLSRKKSQLSAMPVSDNDVKDSAGIILQVLCGVLLPRRPVVRLAVNEGLSKPNNVRHLSAGEREHTVDRRLTEFDSSLTRRFSREGNVTDANLLRTTEAPPEILRVWIRLA